jgi:hypothetical protein
MYSPICLRDMDKDRLTFAFTTLFFINYTELAKTPILLAKAEDTLNRK